jgi:hypothetical protein
MEGLMDILMFSCESLEKIFESEDLKTIRELFIITDTIRDTRVNIVSLYDLEKNEKYLSARK